LPPPPPAGSPAGHWDEPQLWIPPPVVFVLAGRVAAAPPLSHMSAGTRRADRLACTLACRVTEALLKSASQLLEDLNNHVRLLGTPERAQVLLAAAQHPLMSDHASAKLLLPRLCSTILSAPSAARHVRPPAPRLPLP
jgi:hypothetical protein